jgi:hypothetical protein
MGNVQFLSMNLPPQGGWRYGLLDSGHSTSASFVLLHIMLNIHDRKIKISIEDFILWMTSEVVCWFWKLYLCRDQ